MNTEDSSEDISIKVARLALKDKNRGVPCLIGPTQYGKSFHSRKILETMGKEMVIINPQNDLPEDIAGWPHREGSVLSFTQPSIIPPHLIGTNNYGILIDELDKAREDTLSSLLTLLDPGERRLRATKIPDDVPILVCMNEPKRELPEPLVARLLFLAYPSQHYTYDKALDKWGISSLLSVPEISFPKRAKAPGSFYKLDAWAKENEFWSDKLVQETVLCGLFPPELVAGVREKLQESDFSINFETWAKNCTPLSLAKQFYLVSHCSDFEQHKAGLKILEDRVQNNDPTGELLAVIKLIFSEENSSKLYFVNRDREACIKAGEEVLAQHIENEKKKVKDMSAPTEKKKRGRPRKNV